MDRDNLRNWINYTAKIQNTAESGRQVAATFGGNVTVWEPVIGQAATVMQHGRDVLAAE